MAHIVKLAIRDDYAGTPIGELSLEGDWTTYHFAEDIAREVAELLNATLVVEQPVDDLRCAVCARVHDRAVRCEDVR